FKAAFDSQYYPQAYQNVKMEEFLQLEQGIMTILEYEKKFNELSKYCLPLVEDEIKKCQLFIMGLKASIRDIVISQRLTNFGDVVMSASLIESSQMMVRPWGEPHRQQFDVDDPSQGSFKRGSYSSGSSSGRSYGGYRPGFSSSGGSNQSGSSGNRSGGSAARGGVSPNVPSGITECYYCGQSGHFRNDCPLLLQNREITAASTPGTGIQGRSQGAP
ncbi:PREDICTED: retrotransposon, partial [Prunus dulcis]